VNTRTLDLDTAHGPMPLYEARPDGDAHGAVIVVQEAFGVNTYIEGVARRFADAGYHAVAPHFFHRAGGGTAPYDDFAKVIPLYEHLDDEGILIDVDAARAHLRGAWDGTAVGVVGFCFGGRVTFLTALRRKLGAAVGYYGGGIVTQRFPQFPPLVDEVLKLQTPYLGLFGDRDQSIPVEDVERLRDALKSAPVLTEIVRYPEAGHGFHCDQREAHDETAAKDGWNRTLAWFETHMAVTT
jgi:carboxymethylenebutenolidase